MAGRRHVLIIGGGYSGVALTLALLRRDAPNLDVTLVEAGNKLGRGLAYATERDFCLLNSPAGTMSLMPDDPLHFVRWLQANGVDTTPHTFARRHDFGSYIEDSLIRAIDDRWRARSRLRLRIGTGAREVVPQPTGFSVVLDDDERFACDAVVLAAGHLAVGDPLASWLPVTAARYIRASQDEKQLAAISAGDTVLLLGTGLTMVDVALTLHRNGHREPIQAVSRRGLLPQAHEHEAVPLPAMLAMKLEESIDCRSVRSSLRALRRLADQAEGAGSGWRPVIDAARGEMPRFWFQLPVAERRRFVRVLRPYWETHRHRMAPAVADEIGQLLQSSRLRIQAASIAHARDRGNCIRVALRPRGTDRKLEYRYDWVVQCTGPGALEVRGTGVIGRLLEQGLLQRDELGLGLESAPDGTAIGEDGRVPGLYLLGPARRPYDWEQTAAPELRHSAERLAATLESEWIGGRMSMPAIASPEQRSLVHGRSPV